MFALRKEWMKKCSAQLLNHSLDEILVRGQEIINQFVLNGINLSCKCLRGNLLTKLASRTCHERVHFWASLADAWLVTTGTPRIDEEFQLGFVFAG